MVLCHVLPCSSHKCLRVEELAEIHFLTLVVMRGADELRVLVESFLVVNDPLTYFEGKGMRIEFQPSLWDFISMNFFGELFYQIRGGESTLTQTLNFC